MFTCQEQESFIVLKLDLLILCQSYGFKNFEMMREKLLACLSL
ncbi:hypothetical protein PL9214720062 [Planktothrix tepida PCC 9214]|uniref:Uncharacterized protein n=1 Tax=Planktothrix tepida PCC 9214 TaxID=671072 RepID=A0A1J1LT70_9CYAN|nr:hypothetical protein [Planktothrix tepida]CUR35792.1 hypothetical protein PL9214720062 [Planktothrix tepida PCC 9214]